MELRRTLAIGDIHGAHTALEQVLTRSNYDFKSDQLVCMGDYVDGWPYSAGVVDMLINIQESARHLNGIEPIFIRGNHDVWCGEWLNTGVADPIWLEQGGRATMASYVSTGLLTDDLHRKFFRNLHNYYVDEYNRVFVHGGYTSLDGIGNEEYHATYYWDRDLWDIALSGHGAYKKKANPMPKLLRPHTEIYIGHTSTVNWDTDKPMNACNVWNLDTGAGYSSKLTIMDVDTNEYWQSDLITEIYPGQFGR